MSTTMRTAGSGGEIHSFCAMNSLSMSFCIVPPSWSQRDPLLLGQRQVHRERHRGRAVDGHRRGDLVERDVAEQELDVGEGGDRHALAADLAASARVVGVVAHQRGHVEGGGEPGLPLLEQEAGSGGWCPPAGRSRRTCASSRACRGTSTGTARACTGTRRDSRAARRSASPRGPPACRAASPECRTASRTATAARASAPRTARTSPAPSGPVRTWRRGLGHGSSPRPDRRRRAGDAR